MADLLENIVMNRPQAQDHLTHVAMWRQWYQGYVKDFHPYFIYNGKTKVRKVAKSLQMAKKVSEDWADLLYNEHVKITLASEQDNDVWETIREQLDLDVAINQSVEKGFALGTVGLVFSLTADKRVTFSTAEADQIFPITYDNGIITECAFMSTKLIKNKMYAYITVHQKNEAGNYVIENALYELEDAASGSPSVLTLQGTEASYWTYETDSQDPWFAILKPNCTNNTDSASPWGVSVYANAISELKVIDNAFDAIDNEITNGRMRIMVSTDALNYNADGSTPTEVFDARETVFHQLPKDVNQPNTITTVAPSLRSTELIESLNNALSIYARKCGMSSEQYVYKSGAQRVIEQTATEVISNNSPMYRRMRKHEILLKSYIISILKAVSSVYAKAGNPSFSTEVITIDFDDSIITDSNVERTQELRDVESCILTRAEYRAKWYGEDLDQAEAGVKKALAEQKSTEAPVNVNSVTDSTNKDFSPEK